MSCSRCECSIDPQAPVAYRFNDDIYYLTMCESCAVKYEEYEDHHEIYCVDCDHHHSTEESCIMHKNDQEEIEEAAPAPKIETEKISRPNAERLRVSPEQISMSTNSQDAHEIYYPFHYEEALIARYHSGDTEYDARIKTIEASLKHYLSAKQYEKLLHAARGAFIDQDICILKSKFDVSFLSKETVDYLRLMKKNWNKAKANVNMVITKAYVKKRKAESAGE